MTTDNGKIIIYSCQNGKDCHLNINLCSKINLWKLEETILIIRPPYFNTKHKICNLLKFSSQNQLLNWEEIELQGQQVLDPTEAGILTN